VTAHQIQQGFNLGMVDNDLAIITNINQIVGMQAIMLIDIDAGIAVTKGEDDAGFQPFIGFGRNDTVQTTGKAT